ncbi:hypothetical protein BJ944DRAFT_71603 [Cunninghamella echinulata]|nr:hypothetical protein BJ944DRAFT_71603 [Cunninghamella echinulata]
MSTPPSPPSGIVSANIKLFNDRAVNTTTTTNDKNKNNNNAIKHLNPPPIPLSTKITTKPVIPTNSTIKHSISTHTTPNHHSIENIRRHVTGDRAADYHHQQLQHQKVFPHATGNGLLQSSHHTLDDTVFSNTSQRGTSNNNNSFLSPPPPPPPPPPRPAASLISSIDAKYNNTTSANDINTTYTTKSNTNNTITIAPNTTNTNTTTTNNLNINNHSKLKTININTSNNIHHTNNKKEVDSKSNGLSSHVNTNVFKGVFGKVVGSVNGKDIIN